MERIVNGIKRKIITGKHNQEFFIDENGDEKWVSYIKCVNCGAKIFGTHGWLAETVPICDGCEKTRKLVKRGKQ